MGQRKKKCVLRQLLKLDAGYVDTHCTVYSAFVYTVISP